MSDFANEDNIAAGLAGADTGVSGCAQDFYKTTLTAVAAFYYSGWLMGGAPAAGVAPTAWATPTKATVGCWCPKLVNGGPKTNRVLLTEITQANPGQNLILGDRVGHMGGLSGTSVAAQTVNGTLTTPAAGGRCAADGSDVMWFLEWYVATGSTAITATVNVTYNDDSTGNVTVSLPASVPASRMYPILPAVAGKTINGVNTVTNSATTGTAGNYGVTAYKRLGSSSVLTASYTDKQDYAYLGMRKVGDDACVVGFFYTTTTSLGIVHGTITIGGA